MRLGLIADDVTGAGDASVQFARRGWETFLTLQAGTGLGADEGVARLSTASDCVIAVSTDARARDNDTASQLTRGALEQLIAAGIDRVFLKIDSTMRGSVPGQIAGALAAWRTRHADARAIVCPAYPRMGRTVENGRLLVGGVPVERTAIGRDPVTPVTTSDMRVLVPPSPSIALVDAVAVDALAALAAEIAAAGPAAIAVGSGGLAEALAAEYVGRVPQEVGQVPQEVGRVLDYKTRPTDLTTRPTNLGTDSRTRPRILLLVTSLNPVSHAQVARLREACPDVTVVLAPVERVTGTSVADTLAVEFAAHVERGGWSLVGLVGGDGARAALSRLGASGIRILDSLVEGIPLGVVVGGKADGLPVFTKAGGFGSEDALVAAIKRMNA